MRIAIFCKSFNSGFEGILKKMITYLVQNGIELQFIDTLKPYVSQYNNQFNYFSSYNDLKIPIDVFISIGGDGTFLDAVTFVRDRDIPILGINSGRLGFLADIAPENVLEAMMQIINRNFVIEDRSLLEVIPSSGFESEFPFALNDFSIRKSNEATLIKIHTWVNNEFLNSYWADGLIISTPTGSTAYSMSVGGPIVVPHSNNFIISPIASHNLTVRPVVVDAQHDVRLKVESRTNLHLASLDSRTVFFDTETEFLLRKASFTVKVIKTKGYSYFNTIRNKLMWGIDRRN